jgi:hypothetical protein
MKKLLIMLTMLLGLFTLAGCDGFMEGNEFNLWYDEPAATLYVSFNLDKPSIDEETGERPVQSIHLMMYDNETNEWVEIHTFDKYRVEEEQISFDYSIYGDVRFKVVILDADLNEAFNTPEVNIRINEPQYIYHFDTWFDNNNGAVQFNFGVNEFDVKKVKVERSSDGGLTWTEVLSTEITVDQNGYVKNQIQYYEYEEGTYVYKLKAFNEQGENVGEMNTWNEINVWYDNHKFEGDPQIWHVDMNYDTHSKMVNIWWDGEGEFDGFLLEKSTDQQTWELVEELPRIAHSYNYQELIDGEYYYRVSAVTNGTVLLTQQSPETIRVKQDALLGNFNGWMNWNDNSINLDWHFNSDKVDKVVISQSRNDGAFEVIGEFGALKNSYKAEDLLPGTYTFKVTLLDTLGTELDSLESNGYEIQPPNYVHYFDYWFDNWNAMIQFNFDVDKEYVAKVAVERSDDGGLTWTEILTRDLDENSYEFNQIEHFEFEEGTYVYKLKAFNDLDEVVGEMNNHNEIHVNFDNHQFEGDPQIWHIDMNFDSYSNMVNIWWDGEGEFDGFLLEKSTDQQTWELVEELPRIAHSYNYQETVDGQYYYRVSAVTDGVTLLSYESSKSIRVKQGALISNFNGWMDWNDNSVHLDWNFNSDQVGQVIIESSKDGVDYEVIGEFGELKNSFRAENLLPGMYTFRVSLLDAAGTVLDSLESDQFDIPKPEHVHHLNAWHNQSTGEVEFDFNFNYDFVTNYKIEKSVDGGLTWEFVVENQVEYNNSWYNMNIRVYELTEGVYTYRITGYDNDGNEMGTAHSWNEVRVRYDHLNFDEPTDIHYLDGNTDIYDQSVSLWWGGQGTFETHLIEYSTDQETWVTYQEVPRVSTNIRVTDLDDGTYYFRVSAVDETGAVLDTFEMEQSIRVKENAKIGSFRGWSHSNGEIELYWDMIKDDIAMVKIERRLESETTYDTTFEFGPFKTTLFDTVTVSGEYVYKLTLLDTDGTVLDEMESNVINVYVETNTTP